MDGKVFITSKEVIDFVDNFSLSRRGFQSDAEIFRTLLDELKMKQAMFYTIEKQAYKALNVSGIQELQKKIDDLNNSGLFQFQATYLNKAGNLLSKFASVDDNEIAEVIANEIADSPELQLMNEEAALNLVKEKLEEIVTKQRNLRTPTSSRKRRHYVRKGSKGFEGLAAAIYAKVQGKKIGEVTIPTAYKKELKGYVNNIQEKPEGFMWEIDFNDVPAPLEGASMSYYPYFGLTKEQRAEALDLSSGSKGAETWANFKKHICEVAANTVISNTTINIAMDYLGPAAFIKTDVAGVQGILGELQMLLIAMYLIGDKSHVVMPSGQLRNELTKNRAELGADVLIDSTIGIQVKNYKGYLTEEGHRGFHLKTKPISWDTLVERFYFDDISDIGTYFAARCYNAPLKGTPPPELANSLPAYRHFYENKLNNKTGSLNLAINSFFAANMDKFLTLVEAYEIASTGLNPAIENDLEGGYLNAFFIFGGEKLIPTSRLLKALINRIEMLYQTLTGRGHGDVVNFSNSISYSGDVWAPREEIGSYPSMASVLSNIKISTSLNIFLSDLDI